MTNNWHDNKELWNRKRTMATGGAARSVIGSHIVDELARGAAISSACWATSARIFPGVGVMNLHRENCQAPCLCDNLELRPNLG